MSLRLTVLSILILFLTSFAAVAQTSEPRVQEFFTRLDEDNSVAFFDLFGMDEDTTLYVYAESYDIDPFIAICDIDCEEDFFEFNNDIDGRNNRNAAFSYTFEENEDFSILVRDATDNTRSGVFRILIGLDAPEVLSGEAFPTGDPFAVIYQPTYIDLTEIDYDDDEPQAQQFYGELDSETPFVLYNLLGIEAGQTLYLYTESPDFNPAASICVALCKGILSTVEGGDTGDTALTYTFETAGDFQIKIEACCDASETGTFRLLLGINEPLIAKDLFLPNGARLASVYDTPRTLVQSDISRDEETLRPSCEEIDLGVRPELSGDEETVETENFIIHYTTRGNDSADEDYIGEVAAFVEIVYDVQINQLGWAAPPRDCGEGGDSRYDFYLMDILDRDGILGYAEPDAMIGDNPSSTLTEEWSAYGHMVIDNDYDDVSRPLVVMRATIAHEFHHLVQFGYDIADEAFWLYESTSSWVETLTSEEEDATGYTEAVFDEPNLCIGNRDDRSGVRIYGEWLLLDSIAQDFGNDAITTLWEVMIYEEGMDAFYEFLDDLGTTSADVLQRYAIRNLLLDYALGDKFPETVDVEEVIEDFETYDSGRDGIEEMGVQYIFIRDTAVYTFELDNDDLTMVVAGINPDDNQVDIYEVGLQGTVDTNQYDYTYIIIMNPQQHNDPEDCDEEDWELTVRDGSGDDLTQPVNETFNVVNFDPAD